MLTPRYYQEKLFDLALDFKEKYGVLPSAEKLLSMGGTNFYSLPVCEKVLSQLV